MFEDSLVESAGRIRTRSRRYAVGSSIFEAVLVAVIILIPYLYPAALPQRLLTVPLIEPPRAPAAATPEQHATASAARPRPMTLDLTAPSRIPNTIPQVVDPVPPGDVVGSMPGPGQGNGVPKALFGDAPPPPVREVHPPKPAAPYRISEGVAQGQLLVPIRPVYPAIALATRTQGTVVVAATISTQGRIENLRVVSGPPLLVNAAVQAIQVAKYRPYLLNGSPVEVETTISVVFRLDGNT
jgi:periplasmic protein TonB